MTPCPHCGLDVNGCNYSRHVRICQHYPGRSTLEQWAAQGMSQVEISRRCGVGRSIISKWMRAIGIHYKPRREYPGRQAISQARDRGLTQREIGQLFGVSQRTICVWLAREAEEDEEPESNRPGPAEYYELSEDKSLYPMFQCYDKCETCPAEAECRERVAAGLWVLCERPTKWMVRQAGLA